MIIDIDITFHCLQTRHNEWLLASREQANGHKTTIYFVILLIGLYYLCRTETQSDGSQIIIEFNYDKLSKFRQLYLFMQSTIPALLHLPVPNEKVHQAPLPNTMDINIGPLRIRQLRTKQKDCETDIPFINCYHMIYDDETAEKGDMNSSESWAKYTSASTNKIDYKTKGGLSDYDGGGYVLDLYTHNTTVEYIKLLFQKLLQAQFLGESTRAIIISHTSYSPSIDMFMDTVIVIYIYIYILIYI